jgi:hypothetical protein
MIPHDDATPNDELELRRGLRQLPREREPARELWSGIEARLAPAVAARRPVPHRRWIAGAFAAAASLALAIGILLRPDPMPAPNESRVAGTASAASGKPLAPLRREADALTIEYEVALAVFAAAPLSPDMQAAATELDTSAAQLRDALRAQPQATYLLDRLRHTYDQRLKLTQRAVLG